MRTEDNFEIVWTAVLKMVAVMQADEPRLPRQSRLPLRYEQSQGSFSTVHCFSSPKEHLRAQYNYIIIYAKGALIRRIEDKAIHILVAIENVMQKGWRGNIITEDCNDIIILSNHFRGDLQISRLVPQSITLENFRLDLTVSQNNDSMADIVEAIGAVRWSAWYHRSYSCCNFTW